MKNIGVPKCFITFDKNVSINLNRINKIEWRLSGYSTYYADLFLDNGEMVTIYGDDAIKLYKIIDIVTI